MTEGRRTWIYVALGGGGVVAMTVWFTSVHSQGFADGSPPEAAQFDLVVVEIVLLVTVLIVGYLKGRSRRYGGNGPEGEAETAGGDDELTDRDRIYRLVESNGGGMRQADIVRHFTWSKAKVSRLVTELEREGEIRKVQLGRENRIYLDGCEPAASRSPFEQLGETRANDDRGNSKRTNGGRVADGQVTDGRTTDERAADERADDGVPSGRRTDDERMGDGGAKEELDEENEDTGPERRDGPDDES